VNLICILFEIGKKAKFMKYVFRITCSVEIMFLYSVVRDRNNLEVMPVYMIPSTFNVKKICN
jgi:hypothetical protein